MTIEHLLTFNLALFAAIVSPGPALLVAIQTSLGSGRKAGLAIGCGLGVMAALWTMLALLGLEIIFRLIPWAYTLIRFLGALYLIYVALKMWRGACKPVTARKNSIANAFKQGVLINVLNPKSVLFAAAVLVVIFPQNMSMMENTIIVINHLVIEIMFYTLLAFCLNTPMAKNAYLKAKFYTDRIASIILGALGLRLLLGQ